MFPFACLCSKSKIMATFSVQYFTLLVKILFRHHHWQDIWLFNHLALIWSCTVQLRPQFVRSCIFSRYVVQTLLTPTFRRNWCWFQLGPTLCHDVLSCCHAIATPEPRYCPVLTRLTSDTGKFSCVVLRYVSLPPRSSLAVATLSYAVPRIWRSIACHNEPET